MNFCNSGEVAGTKDVQTTSLQKIYRNHCYGKRYMSGLPEFPQGVTGPPLGVAVLTGDHDIFCFAH